MEEIWRDWEEHYSLLNIADRIKKDGIIDPLAFNRTKRRILFILKEPNSLKEEDDDLRKLFREHKWYTVGNFLARWSTGILKQFPPYETIENDKNLLYECFMQVAVINLKKTNGTGESDTSVINTYAHQDKALLVRQIQSISPNLIVACGVKKTECGVIDILVWLLDLRVPKPNVLRENVLEYTKGSLVIPFKHPSSRMNYKDSYEQLRKSLEKIK